MSEHGRFMHSSTGQGNKRKYEMKLQMSWQIFLDKSMTLASVGLVRHNIGRVAPGDLYLTIWVNFEKHIVSIRLVRLGADEYETEQLQKQPIASALLNFNIPNLYFCG